MKTSHSSMLAMALKKQNIFATVWSSPASENQSGRSKHFALASLEDTDAASAALVLVLYLHHLMPQSVDMLDDGPDVSGVIPNSVVIVLCTAGCFFKIDFLKRL